MEKQVQKLWEEVEKIKARNRRVEGDKAWETSKTRNIFIALTTYLLIYVFLLLISDQRPFLNALVGAVAYLLSTASYGMLKTWWLKRRKTS